MEHLKAFLADGGLKSRKFILSLLCLLLLCAFVGAAAHWAGIAGLYPEFVGGILGVLSIYVTGNAAGRWATSKHLGDKLAAQADAKPDAPEASDGK